MGHVKVIVVAGTNSGVGKTTVAVGLMAALRCRGLKVQPFKVGPDFLDPLHHRAATGRDSINLDGWMMDKKQNVDAFYQHCQDCDIAIIEGVMGLFDGTDGQTEQGSTAQMAKWLRATVVLVLECWSVARSVAAMVKGYQSFDKDLAIGGVILNKVAGQAHATWLQEAIQHAGLPTVVLGGLPKNPQVEVGEDSLGLRYPHQDGRDYNHVRALAEFVEQHVNLEALLNAAAIVEVPHVPPVLPPPPQRRVKIAVAKDDAFCFYYQQNLFLLQRAGAELIPFSPLKDTQLPAGVAAILVGGGYPEQYAARLAANRPMLQAMHAFSAAGGVVYAECGGLMYLSESLELEDGVKHPMVGIFPFRTRLAHQKRMRMGYVEVEAQPGCRLFPAGSRIRGQVYHFSEIVEEHVVSTLGSSPASSIGKYMYSYMAQMLIPGSTMVPEGYSTKNTLASYVHLHFGSAPGVVQSFLEQCWGVDVEGAHTAARNAVLRCPSTPPPTPTGSLHSQQTRPDQLDHTGACRATATLPATDTTLPCHPCRISTNEVGEVEASTCGASEKDGSGGSACPSTRSASPAPSEDAVTPPPTGWRKSGMGLIAQQLLAAPEALLHLARANSMSPRRLRKSRSMSLSTGGVHANSAGSCSAGDLADCASAMLPPPPNSKLRDSLGTGPSKSTSMMHLSDLNGGSNTAMGRSEVSGSSKTFGRQWGLPLRPASMTDSSASSMTSMVKPKGSDDAAAPNTTALRAMLLERRACPLSSMAGAAKAGVEGTAGGSDAGLMLPVIPQLELDERIARSGTASTSDAGMGTPGRPLSLAVRNSSRSSMESRQGASPFGRGSNDSIVSFTPPVTDMFIAMGLSSRIAGVTELCEVRSELSKKSGLEIAVKSRRPGGNNGHFRLERMQKPELESWVSQLRQQGLGLYRVNDDFLRQERPGLVVIQDSCELYHPDKFTVQKALERAGLLHTDCSTAVLHFSASNLSDVLEFILTLGRAAGAPEAGAMLTERLRSRLRRVAAAVTPRPVRPRLLCLQSVKPIVEAGRWLPEMAQLAGARVAGHMEVGDAPLSCSWESVLAFAPEVLLFSHPLQGMERTLVELAELAALPGWWTLPAVRNGQVYIIHASLLARPGPGLVDGVELLARICHPASVRAKVGQGLVLKLSLQGGQRCRSRLLPNYFMPFL